MSWRLAAAVAVAASSLVGGGAPGAAGPLLGVSAAAAATAAAAAGSSSNRSRSSSLKGAECFEYGYDYHGFDIHQMPLVLSASVCMEECARFAGCGVFTYDTVSRMCYLKSLGAFTDRRPAAQLVSGPRQCTFTSYCYDVGMDYYGEDVERVEGRYVMTPMDCQRLCSANPQCAFFSWKLSSHACYLKSAAAALNRRADADVTSGPRTCSTAGSQVAPRPDDYPTEFDPATAPTPCVETGVEYKGFTVKSTRAKSSAACHRECQHYSGCHYWTFSAQTEVCSLKSSEALNGRTQNVTTLDKVSAARDCIPVMPGCQYANVGVIGARLTTRSARSFDVCQIYCASHSGCTHFSHNVVTEECALWSSFNTYSQGTSTKAIVSGPAFCNAQEVCYEQSDYVGHNVDEDETGEVKSPAACQALCRRNSECHYWTYYANNKGCYLKDANAILGRTNDMTSLGRYSGPKYCTVSHGCVLINAVYTGLAFLQEEAEDYQVCSSICGGNTFCSAWTFHSGLGICSLFSDGALLARMPVRGAISGDKACTANASEEESCFDEGIFYNYKPISSVDALTAKACYAKCGANHNCKHWSFASGKCHMFGSYDPPPFRYDPDSVSGPQRCPGETLAGQNLRVNASPMLKTYTYSPLTCMRKCGQTPHCKFFSFLPGNDDLNCNLFEELTEDDIETFGLGELSPDLMGQLMPPSFVASQCSFSSPLSSVTVNSPLECQAECVATPLCEAWQTKPQPAAAAAMAAGASPAASGLTCSLFKSADNPSKIKEPDTVCGTKVLPGSIAMNLEAASVPTRVPTGERVTFLQCMNFCVENPDNVSWVFNYSSWCQCKDTIDPPEEGSLMGRINRPSPTLLFNVSYQPAGQAAVAAPFAGGPVAVAAAGTARAAAAPAAAVSLHAARRKLASGFTRRLQARPAAAGVRMVSSMNECIAECARDAMCSAWTFKDHNCSLFSAAAIPTPDTGAISGRRSTGEQPFTLELNKKWDAAPKVTSGAPLKRKWSAQDDDDDSKMPQAAAAGKESVPASVFECAEQASKGECFSFKSSEAGNVCYIYDDCVSMTDAGAEGYISGKVEDDY
ncbi:hypothetical protein Efla_001662 [Eimeria flavescens]